MGNFAAIVAPQTVAEVFGQADVKVFWMRFAFQDVNVLESLANLLSASRECFSWLAES